MRFVTVFGLALVGGAAVFAGCSADESTGLFGSSGGNTSSSTSSGSSGEGGQGGMGGGASSSSSSASSSTSGGGSTSSSTSSSSGSMSSSASSSASSSSTGGPTGPTVACAGNDCNPGDVCCFHLQNQDLDACGAPGSCDPNQNFITLSCDGPEDCPGQICCGYRPPQSTYEYVQCADTCTGSGYITLCDPNNPVCPQDGQTCQQSGTLPTGYFVCRF